MGFSVSVMSFVTYHEAQDKQARPERQVMGEESCSMTGCLKMSNSEDSSASLNCTAAKHNLTLERNVGCTK